MQGMMIFRWSGAKAGREAEAMKFADESDAYFSKLKGEGKIAGYEWVSNFTGSDFDMFVVRGDPQVLGAIAMSPEAGGLIMKGNLFLDDWHWDMAASGATVDDVYPGWRALVGA
jgi:hypothetical protein